MDNKSHHQHYKSGTSNSTATTTTTAQPQLGNTHSINSSPAIS